MRIFVTSPNIYAGDAVGNHCLGIARACARLGLECSLYAQGFVPVGSGVRHVDQLGASDVRADDILLICHSIFDPNFDRLIALPCRKFCFFQGITPPELLRELDAHVADLCQRGLDQTRRFGEFERVLVSSEFNARSLATIVPEEKLRILPPVFPDMPIFFQNPAPSKSSCSGQLRLLNVGRVVPHKAVEDSISLLHALRESGVNASMTVVGMLPNPDYFKSLIAQARGLNLLDSICFSGTLADADLYRVYAQADLLVTTSLHEGFCVPVLEAMHFGCGVLVRAGTAAADLVPPDEVFSMGGDHPAKAFLQAFSLLRQRQAAIGFPEAMYSRAAVILNNASDAAWSKVLLNT